MTEIKWQEKKSPYTTPRYVVFSLAGTLSIAMGILGFMSDRQEIGQLLGEYQSLIHSNWQYLVMFGLFLGITNFLIAFSNR